MNRAPTRTPKKPVRAKGRRPRSIHMIYVGVTKSIDVRSFKVPRRRTDMRCFLDRANHHATPADTRLVEYLKSP